MVLAVRSIRPYRSQCMSSHDGLPTATADMDQQTTPEHDRVVLYWIPLGAGGAVAVRVSGRVYEWTRALVERRRPLDLYHTALEVDLEGNRFIIENAWPSPDDVIGSRGVVNEGPVWSLFLGRFRMFRYEIRCWRDGVISDFSKAAATLTLTCDRETARRLLELAPSVPVEIWGRDPSGIGEMWSSNSVISYLLAVSGLPAAHYPPPAGGRAPGWATGITVATCHQSSQLEMHRRWQV